MSVLARIIIALIVGPGVGALSGQELARVAASRGGASAGLVARAEMSGLLVGGLVGVLFALLAIRCTVALGGRLRGRFADVALLPVGILAALVLLAGQQHAPADVTAALRWTMIAVWLLGLVLLLTSLCHRPPEPAPAPPEPEPIALEVPPQPAGEWDRYVSEAENDE